MTQLFIPTTEYYICGSVAFCYTVDSGVSILDYFLEGLLLSYTILFLFEMTLAPIYVKPNSFLIIIVVIDNIIRDPN
eukprot:snap_masked-scaffold_1-processed-gene-17.44-mRNA-1 protein AED:1.00 eAED:1.00 QI:0/0/0/0/1/1/4/0/76